MNTGAFSKTLFSFIFCHFAKILFCAFHITVYTEEKCVSVNVQQIDDFIIKNFSSLQMHKGSDGIGIKWSIRRGHLFGVELWRSLPEEIQDGAKLLHPTGGGSVDVGSNWQLSYGFEDFLPMIFAYSKWRRNRISWAGPFKWSIETFAAIDNLFCYFDDTQCPFTHLKMSLRVYQDKTIESICVIFLLIWTVCFLFFRFLFFIFNTVLRRQTFFGVFRCKVKSLLHLVLNCSGLILDVWMTFVILHVLTATDFQN